MATKGKPNILFLMSDDIGWFNISCNNQRMSRVYCRPQRRYDQFR